ncbi:hypothetical protein LTR66_013745, partial [Elasticomyces elasticus]
MCNAHEKTEDLLGRCVLLGAGAQRVAPVYKDLSGGGEVGKDEDKDEDEEERGGKAQ